MQGLALFRNASTFKNLFDACIWRTYIALRLERPNDASDDSSYIVILRFFLEYIATYVAVAAVLYLSVDLEFTVVVPK